MWSLFWWLLSCQKISALLFSGTVEYPDVAINCRPALINSGVSHRYRKEPLKYDPNKMVRLMDQGLLASALVYQYTGKLYIQDGKTELGGRSQVAVAGICEGETPGSCFTHELEYTYNDLLPMNETVEHLLALTNSRDLVTVASSLTQDESIQDEPTANDNESQNFSIMQVLDQYIPSRRLADRVEQLLEEPVKKFPMLENFYEELETEPEPTPSLIPSRPKSRSMAEQSASGIPVRQFPLPPPHLQEYDGPLLRYPQDVKSSEGRNAFVAPSDTYTSTPPSLPGNVASRSNERQLVSPNLPQPALRTPSKSPARQPLAPDSGNRYSPDAFPNVPPRRHSPPDHPSGPPHPFPDNLPVKKPEVDNGLRKTYKSEDPTLYRHKQDRLSRDNERLEYEYDFQGDFESGRDNKHPVRQDRSFRQEYPERNRDGRYDRLHETIQEGLPSGRYNDELPQHASPISKGGAEREPPRELQSDFHEDKFSTLPPSRSSQLDQVNDDIARGEIPNSELPEGSQSKSRFSLDIINDEISREEQNSIKGSARRRIVSNDPRRRREPFEEWTDEYIENDEPDSSTEPRRRDRTAAKIPIPERFPTTIPSPISDVLENRDHPPQSLPLEEDTSFMYQDPVYVPEDPQVNLETGQNLYSSPASRSNRRLPKQKPIGLNSGVSHVTINMQWLEDSVSSLMINDEMARVDCLYRAIARQADLNDPVRNLVLETILATRDRTTETIDYKTYCLGTKLAPVDDCLAVLNGIVDFEIQNTTASYCLGECCATRVIERPLLEPDKEIWLSIATLVNYHCHHVDKSGVPYIGGITYVNYGNQPSQRYCLGSDSQACF